MGNYVICPDRDGKKVSLEVCVKKCELKDICEKYLEVTTKATEPETGNLEASTGDHYHAFTSQTEDTDVKSEEIPDPGKGEAKIVNPPAIPTKRAKELYDKVLSLKSQIEVKWFQLGKVLEEIFEGKHYISLGYKTWKHFCEEALKPLELKWRALDYLRTTRLKCDEVGIEEKVAGEIGWSRLKELIPVITKENKDQWINEARNPEMTTQILNAKVRVARGRITEEQAKILPIKVFFSLFPEQNEMLERTLELASKMAGSESKGYLLADVICVEFLATYPSGSDDFQKAEIVSKSLNRLGEAMKVKFVGEVLDSETGEIIFQGK